MASICLQILSSKRHFINNLRRNRKRKVIEIPDKTVLKHPQARNHGRTRTENNRKREMSSPSPPFHFSIQLTWKQKHESSCLHFPKLLNSASFQSPAVLINKGKKTHISLNASFIHTKITKNYGGLPDIFLLVALGDIDVCTARLQLHLLHLSRGGG